jgi:glycerophosphoryl diester phosphodiesterase
MTDYEEKLYALTAPDGRMTADSHRGDEQNYPENSIPGILSAILMGADVVEIDIRLTKDNIMVLMHDASLKRTTDWSAKAGKNGLPTSDKIEDWTYKQLRELRLLYNGKASDCIIPTMYEAALLFGGRSQIHFDCKVADKLEVNSDIFLLAEATGSKESFIYYYGLDTMVQWQSLNKSDESFKQFVAKMNKYLKMSGHAFRKRNFEMIEKHGDNVDGWQKAWNEGYKMTFTNKIYDFCQYLAKNGEPFKLP